MSKNGPGRSDKGKGRAPRRPQSPDTSPEEEDVSDADTLVDTGSEIEILPDPDHVLKPHKCPECPKRFTSRGHMTRHAKGSHGLDCSGQEWLKWDPLKTLAFKAG